MKNNPETRFQEFDEEWTQTTLREISNKVMEKNTDFSIREVFTNSAEHGVMSQRDFFSHAIANDKNINSYYIIHPNDFVYNPRMSVTAPVGPINRNALGRTGIMSPLYYVFRTHNIDVEYLDFFFKTRIWHQFMWNNGDNGARGDRFSIKNEVFQEMPIPYPYSPEEQHKIAQFFSRLDSLITAEDKKLERLKTIKSASLEKMFPKQGESIPEVRFRGFSEEWIKYSFDDTFSIINDSESNIPKTEYQNNGKYPVIDQSKIFIVGFTNKNKPIIPVNGYIIFGDHTREFKYVNFPFYSGADGTQILSCKNDKHISKFIFYNCLALKIPNTGYNRHLKYLKEAILMCPVDINEQHIIADFFSRLDALISAQEQKVKGLRSLKKSFLEKMFVSTPK